MNRKQFTLLAALACCLPGQVLAQAEHHHHGHGTPALQLNAGKKWETDTSLRQAMGNINQTMAEALPRIHKNRFGEGDYQALADKVRKEIAYAVDNCRLDPKADAMLHLIIAELSEGAETMEGKGKASHHAGAIKTLRALESYGRYFNHPGWQAAGTKRRP